MEDSNPPTPYIHHPDDILIKILLLLPFETILYLKLVSKQWKNLISNPKFYKFYRSRSSLSVFFLKNELHCLITRHGNKSPGSVEGRCPPPFTVHRITTGGNSRYYRQKYDQLLLLSGSSEGVACVHVINGNFIIYNLFSGCSFTVPVAPLTQHFFSGWRCFGYGHDSAANDYKIMAVRKHDEDNSRFWVYSFRNHIWESLEGFPYHDFDWDSPRACSVNGVLHWVVTIPETEKKVIVTYDLHTCRFGEISVPKAYNFYSIDRVCVAELDGHLCFWPVFKAPYFRSLNGGPFAKEVNFELWVMKEYGVEESWTALINKSYRIERSLTARRNTSREDIADDLRHLIPTGLYECPNGRKGVFFLYPNTGSLYNLYWYDLGNGKIEVLGNYVVRNRT